MQQPAVVYLITKLELGGAQKVCLALFEGLPANHPRWLISGPQGPLVEHVQNNPHTILLASMAREVSVYALIRELNTLWQLINHLRKLKKQYPMLIVHTHSTKAGLLGRWAALLAGVHYRVHTIHGYAFHPHQSRISWWPIYILELFTSLITTHFVCVSQTDADTGIKLFPHFAKKYSLIHAATDVEQFTKHALTKKTTDYFIIGTVACFKPQKNLFDLLQAFELVHAKHPHTRLEIIGDGMQRTQIELWLHDHQLANAVTLHGWQPNVALIARHWHVFALTSLWEGLPCAVVEARLLKLPVVSYKTGGIPEVITHNVNGLLYEQKDWIGIANGLENLIQDNSFYTKLAEHIDNLESFTYRHMINQHATLYKKLATR